MTKQNDFDLLEMDDKTREFVGRREKRKSRNKLIISIGLAFIIVASILLYYFQVLPKESFQYLWASLIGGFIGSAITYLADEK